MEPTRELTPSLQEATTALLFLPGFHDGLITCSIKRSLSAFSSLESSPELLRDLVTPIAGED
jgi:hypothetical protein